jgi:hypothetical protein|tara:strand:- start:199 stop:534 length:336 start_codon:yes stop_codon:yes gene_type:complete
MSKCISCEWKNNEVVIVNPDGQVFPCCYLSNLAYKYDITKDDRLYKTENENKNKHIMKEYMENKNEYNIFNKPLDQILKSKWFDETLPKSWENYDDAYYKCKRKCTIEKDD